MKTQGMDMSSLKCTVNVPGPDSSVSEFLDRWSDIYCDLPAAVVVPETEEDIVQALHVAEENSLRVVVTGGKHGAFIPITSKTLCLDLSHFTSFSIDETAETVTVGAATLSGDVMKALATKGFYTCVPNSNKVGIVGCFLGGGSGNANSLQGFLCDQVVSVALVTASGQKITLDASCTGDERALFEILQGAGHGLGIITALTIRIFRISALEMTENKIWTRRFILPPSAIDVAATTFEKLQPVKGPIQCSMLFSRALPGSEIPGGPMIALSIMYFGPGGQGEGVLADALTPELTEAAKINATVLTGWEDTNNATEAGNAHGGYKIPESLFFPHINAQTVKTLFNEFVGLGRDCKDAGTTICVIGAYDPTVSQQHEKTAASETVMSGFRNKGTFLYQSAHYTKQESMAAVSDYLGKARDIVLHRKPGEQGLDMRRLPNNFGYPAVLSESYSEAMIERAKSVKERWDPNSLLWSPILGH